MRRLLPALLFLIATVVSTACHRFGSCEAADVNGISKTCASGAGWIWNGSSCIYSQKCVCTGDDCNSMYEKQDICETAHSHCSH